MVIAALMVIAAHMDVYWPVATPDNGYGKYMAAARLLETPYWRKALELSEKKKSAAMYREEAKRSGPIFAAVKKGNSMPIYDPCKVETFATLHPEFAGFVQVTKVVRDVAHAKALDGDWDAASNCLLMGDRFAARLPVPMLINILVRQRLLGLLRRETQVWLPRFGVLQLRDQITELESIATHQPDMMAIVQNELQILHRSIRMTVDDPSTLGAPDQAPDVSTSMDKLLELPEMSPEVTKLIEKVMKAAPAQAQVDPAIALNYLAEAESQVPAKNHDEFQKYLEAVRSAVKPKTYSMSSYAKTLDADSKAHAVRIIEIYCDPPLSNLAGAIHRPKKDWWLKFTPQVDKIANDEVMKDGKEGKFAKVDFFALHLADVINKLSGEEGNDWIDFCQHVLLEREKARLAVVDAKIHSYRATHHRLPANLSVIGAPIDPLGNHPFLYRRTSAKAYEFAAVGIPGVGRIEEKTKTAPSKN